MTALAFVAFPVTLLVLAGLRRTPLARVLVANPSADRWHEQPTPLLGGIGIFAGFSAGLWIAAAAGAFDPTRQLVGIYCGIALLFVAGLVDDVYHLRPLVKLALQFAAGGIVLATGTNVQIVHNHIVAGAIALIWLVGLTNAFNLLDNMDGLAATLAGIAFLFFAIDAMTVHPNDGVLAYATAGAVACLGFLPFNLRPGRKALLFMGDSGSQLLGFALAGLGLSSSWKVAGTTVATLLLPILVLAVPILDTTLVTVARLLEGRPVSQGGLDHSSHRLVRLGLSEKHAVGLLAAIATLIGGTSLTYNVLDEQRFTLAGVVLTFVLLVQFASFLADVERRPLPGEAPGLLQTFAVHWRRLVEVVVDFGLITLSFVVAFVVQFGWPGTINQRHMATITLPILLVTRYLAFIPFGLYRSIWRYAGLRDVFGVASAIIVSELVTVAFMSSTQQLEDFSRSIFIVDGLVCTAVIAGSRAVERGVVVGLKRMQDRTARRALIVGAGRTGRSLMRELRETAGERVVGFVDDNPRLRRRRVHGVPVLGTTAELPRLLQRTSPDIVLVTIPNASRDRLDAVVDACADAGVTCHFVRRDIDLDPRVVLGSAAE
ncbi:MAG: NAD-binding protein [Actinobacteria bacterium]|nr:NAD-binding protein [Actinomycetota bacterium]MBV8396603.1 NAD-binding protein [Actinomycetota bacterium]